MCFERKAAEFVVVASSPSGWFQKNQSRLPSPAEKEENQSTAASCHYGEIFTRGLEISTIGHTQRERSTWIDETHDLILGLFISHSGKLPETNFVS